MSKTAEENEKIASAIIRINEICTANMYSKEEVTDIIKQVLADAAKRAKVNPPSHYALHGTKNVDKESITNIDVNKYLKK